MSDLDVGTMGYLCRDNALSFVNPALESVSDGEEDFAGNEVIYILGHHYELFHHVCCS